MTYYLDNSAFPRRVVDELKLAHDRGVEVRILSTYLPTKVKDPSFKIKTNMSLDDGGATYSFLLVRPGHHILLTNNLHEKIFLVDGQKAVIGGRNLSQKNITLSSKRYLSWKNFKRVLLTKKRSRVGQQLHK